MGKLTLLLRWFILVTLSVCLLVGCSSSKPARFYMLTPVAQKGDVDLQLAHRLKGEPAHLTIGVGPITIAKYLDRSQLVVRVNPHEITLEEFHKWAGSPKDEIPSVLVENLYSLLDTEMIYTYPWKSYLKPDYQIQIEILNLDGPMGGPVHLTARWEIYKGADREHRVSKRADLSEPIARGSNGGGRGISQNAIDNGGESTGSEGEKGGMNGYVAAQSRALGKLSAMIADSLIASF